MGNWFADQIGALAGDIQYAFGGGAALESTGSAVQGENTAAAQADYAPGGRIYNKILNTRGKADADLAWQRVQGDLASQSMFDVLNQEQAAGQEGANQGLDAVTALPGKVTGGLFDFSGGILGGLLKSIPWWLWLLAIGAGAFYIIGPAVLLGRARSVAGKAIGA